MCCNLLFELISTFLPYEQAEDLLKRGKQSKTSLTLMQLLNSCLMKANLFSQIGECLQLVTCSLQLDSIALQKVLVL